MTSASQIQSRNLATAVDEALRTLVHSHQWGGDIFVSLPVFYPSGTAATVRISSNGGRVTVTDGGYAYREIEQIGAEAYFRKSALAVAEEVGATVSKRTLVIYTDFGGLAGAISDMASGSVRIAHKVSARVGAKGEAEIADYLLKRLSEVFGVSQVQSRATLVGPSTREWRIDALVKTQGSTAIFQAVTSHHASVYSTSAMFHDLALLETAPATIAVVRSKAEMGSYLGILAQAGSVLEEGQSDGAYRSAIELSALM
ncbi:hypothetical protein NPJ82_09145 [Sphingomonas sp. NY01]|uniref:hypothetical protein n=1 Tax=Sphingomonas sp. NY01 TaxID=2968057 RepID=UPI00315D3020